jgi:hypothetical protein
MAEFPRLTDEQLLTFMLTMCQPVILELQRRNGRPGHEQTGAVREMMETLSFGSKFDMSGNIALVDRTPPSSGVIVKKDKVVKISGAAAKTRKKPIRAESDEFDDTPPRDPFLFDNGEGVRIEVQDVPVEVELLFSDEALSRTAPIEIKSDKKKK